MAQNHFLPQNSRSAPGVRGTSLWLCVATQAQLGGLYFSFSLFKFLRKGPFAKSEPFHLYFFNENGQYLFFSLVSIFLFIFLLLLSKFSEIPCFSDVLKTLGNKGKSAALWPQLRLLHLAAKKLKAKPSQS